VRIVGWISTVLFTFVVIVALRGWVLTKLWGWFVVTTFGLAQISIPQAIGLSLLVIFFQREQKTEKTGADWFKSEFAGVCWRGIAGPLACLGFGWIYSLFL